jgi:predicted RNA-binding Zn-ribbon protein involved in translation (DUF1610 family)
MAEYILCNNCKKLIEYKPEIHYEGGITYKKLTCPECGHTEITNQNHIHYGDDGKK